MTRVGLYPWGSGPLRDRITTLWTVSLCLAWSVSRHRGGGGGRELLWGPEEPRGQRLGQDRGVQPALRQLRRDGGVPSLRRVRGRQTRSRGRADPLRHPGLHQQVEIMSLSRPVCVLVCPLPKIYFQPSTPFTSTEHFWDKKKNEMDINTICLMKCMGCV